MHVSYLLNLSPLFETYCEVFYCLQQHIIMKSDIRDRMYKGFQEYGEKVIVESTPDNRFIVTYIEPEKYSKTSFHIEPVDKNILQRLFILTHVVEHSYSYKTVSVEPIYKILIYDAAEYKFNYCMNVIYNQMKETGLIY